MLEVNSVYKLSDNPVIYLGRGANNWGNINNDSNKPAYLIAHTQWYFGFKSILLYKKHKQMLKQKNVELIVLCNSKKELRMAKLFGFRCYFINHDMQVNEHVFTIKQDVEKKYDAVYTAQARKFKRLWLAKRVKKLFVITYFWPNPCNDLHVFEPSISHADYNKVRINSDEINDILNKSYCGLALSKKEGAMLAAVEYMFAGLPVVSTKSLGGRETFFDSRYVVMVKDNAEAVAEGVEKAKRLNVSPQTIRESTIKKIDEHRKKFYNLIRDLHSENGQEYMEYDTFYDLYFREDGFKNDKVMDQYGRNISAIQ